MSHYYFIRGYEPNQQKPWAIPESFRKRHSDTTNAEEVLGKSKEGEASGIPGQSWNLHLGKPWEDFPEVPTWRQFLIK